MFTFNVETENIELMRKLPQSIFSHFDYRILGDAAIGCRR